ncbi:MAG: hypothetical protein ACYC6L_10435 [Anaerolineae bacterium]
MYSLWTWRRELRRRYWWVGLIGAVIALVPAFVLGARGALAALPFYTLQPRLMELGRACAAAPVDGIKPYRVGKLLVVQPNGLPYGRVMDLLRAGALGAAKQGEIGTLVRVGEPFKVQALGSDCPDACRLYREVCLIDFASGKVLFRTNLAGSDPFTSG